MKFSSLLKYYDFLLLLFVCSFWFSSQKKRNLIRLNCKYIHEIQSHRLKMLCDGNQMCVVCSHVSKSNTVHIFMFGWIINKCICWAYSIHLIISTIYRQTVNKACMHCASHSKNNNNNHNLPTQGEKSGATFFIESFSICVREWILMHTHTDQDSQPTWTLLINDWN